MSGIVSSMIGANANQRIAEEQSSTSKYGTDISAQVAQRQLEEQNLEHSQNFGLQTQALMEGKEEFGKQFGLQQGQFTSGELSKAAAANNLSREERNIQLANAAASPELLQLKSDIENKGTRSLQDLSKQTAANLATAGVRGGQAATLQGRVMGEAATNAESNIDQLLAEDAAQRRAAKTGFYSNIGTTSAGRL